MKILGITAEYNPFHKGHLYHLQESLSRSGAGGVVAVMSGNFVQRGQPACVDKYRRTRMALAAGVDVVVELPVHLALSSAEGFAAGAVSLLNALGVTDLSYGCEGEDPRGLKALAAFLVQEPQAYQEALRSALKTGKNYPAARQEAVALCLGEETAALLTTPNNILGIEYEKALLRLESDIRTHAIPRSDQGYHATGTALRAALATKNEHTLRELLPQTSLDLLDYHLTAEDFSALLAHGLMGATKEGLLSAHPWLDPELAARIVAHGDPFLSFEAFCDLLTTRNTTRTAVNRALMRLLLGVEGAPLPADGQGQAATPSLGSQAPAFAHLLGFRRDSAILKTLKDRSSIPLITKTADLPGDLYAPELKADGIYALAAYEKTGLKLPDAFHAGPVIL